ncbi:MAG: hypothetical protein ACE5HR_06685, partial [bacterium]
PIEGLSPEEPYISHLNESALQVLDLKGEQRAKRALRGNVFPLEILMSFPRREDEQKQSKVDIQRRRGRVPRCFLPSFSIFYIIKRG